MRGKAILLTGVPAVGKSTLAQAMSKSFTDLEVIEFGKLVLSERQSQNPSTTHESLRRSPTREATGEVVTRAVEKLLQKVEEIRDSKSVLVDSHAVAKDDYGFRVTPDGPPFLTRIRWDAILILHGDPEEVAYRIIVESQGRKAVTSAQVALHQGLQDAVAVSYAVLLGCPVYVIEPQLNFDDLRAKTEVLLRTVGL